MIRRILYILFIPLMVGCSHARIDEAERTLTMADSLRAAGQAYNDSLRLSEAFQIFRARRLSYPDEYARIGYYYGRHLRAVGDYPAAMQAFIAATHAYSYLPFHSPNYEILGRVYSNMAYMCQQSENYELAFEIYAKSANMFEQANNFKAYYFALNNMAFESACMGDSTKTCELLHVIETQCADSAVLTKILETRAVLFHYLHQPDSAIYYTNKLFSRGYQEPTGMLIMAQSFYEKDEKDSALIYAEKVLTRSSFLGDKYNALYILYNKDTTLTNKRILELSAERADLQMEYTHRQESLAQAIQLLELDLAQTPDLRWLYASIVTILLSLAIVILYRIHQKKKHALISQKIAHITAEYSEIQSNIKIQLEKTCTMLRSSDNLKNDLHWKDFDNMCEFVNENLYLFINKLKHEYILNETEIRLCVLVLLDLNRKQIADILPYAQNGVGKFKYRVAQKLGTNGKDLRQFLIQIAVRETGIHP